MSGRPYTRVPVSATYNRAVSDRGVRLYTVLDDMARDWASVFVTVRQLAAILERSEDYIKRARRDLVAAGLLTWEPATNRGERSLWTPLQRPREVRHVGAVPVDNRSGRGAGRGADLHPSHLGKGCSDAPDPRAPYKDRARTQHGVGDNVAWCGHCDSPEYRWISTPSGVTRCPACHPSTVPAF